MKTRLNYFSGAYRYGMNGQERDDEVSGAGNSYTAEFWQYDPRIGRRWNTDPITLPWQSSYSCFNDNPINYNDPLGLTGEKQPQGATTYDPDPSSNNQTSMETERDEFVGELMKSAGVGRDNNTAILTEKARTQLKDYSFTDPMDSGGSGQSLGNPMVADGTPINEKIFEDEKYNVNGVDVSSIAKVWQVQRLAPNSKLEYFFVYQRPKLQNIPVPVFNNTVNQPLNLATPQNMLANLNQTVLLAQQALALAQANATFNQNITVNITIASSMGGPNAQNFMNNLLTNSGFVAPANIPVQLLTAGNTNGIVVPVGGMVIGFTITTTTTTFDYGVNLLRN